MTEKPAPAERADPSPKVAEALGQLRSLLAEARERGKTPTAIAYQRIEHRLYGGAA